MNGLGLRLTCILLFCSYTKGGKSATWKDALENCVQNNHQLYTLDPSSKSIHHDIAAAKRQMNISGFGQDVWIGNYITHINPITNSKAEKPMDTNDVYCMTARLSNSAFSGSKQSYYFHLGVQDCTSQSLYGLCTNGDPGMPAFRKSPVKSEWHSINCTLWIPFKETSLYEVPDNKDAELGIQYTFNGSLDIEYNYAYWIGVYLTLERKTNRMQNPNPEKCGYLTKMGPDIYYTDCNQEMPFACQDSTGAEPHEISVSYNFENETVHENNTGTTDYVVYSWLSRLIPSAMKTTKNNTSTTIPNSSKSGSNTSTTVNYYSHETESYEKFNGDEDSLVITSSSDVLKNDSLDNLTNRKSITQKSKSSDAQAVGAYVGISIGSIIIIVLLAVIVVNLCQRTKVWSQLKRVNLSKGGNSFKQKLTRQDTQDDDQSDFSETVYAEIELANINADVSTAGDERLAQMFENPGYIHEDGPVKSINTATGNARSTSNDENLHSPTFKTSEQVLNKQGITVPGNVPKLNGLSTYEENDQNREMKQELVKLGGMACNTLPLNVTIDFHNSLNTEELSSMQNPTYGVLN